MVQLIALTERPDHVCTRYRVNPFRSYLEKAGHAIEVRALPPRWWSRLGLWPALRGASVLLQRRLLARWEIALLRRGVRHLLFDLDDAVFLRDSYARRGPHDGRRLARFAATVRAADAVIVGNGFLRDQTRRHGPTTHIEVIPTCVEPADYPGTPRPPRARAQLVWVGSSSTLRGLERARPLLEALGRRLSGKVELKLICDRFLTLDPLPVVPCPWTEAGEKEAIARADIGIGWIPDDLWSRGKCGLKVLQYMAAGLPVVANPVGVHPEMVVHGQTGFLAGTEEEWVQAIGRLASDPALRQRMGEAGRRRVEQQYSIRAGAEQWLGLLAALEQGLPRAG